MKKFVLSLLTALLYSSIIPLIAQNLVDENFPYSPGVLSTVSGSFWTNSDAGKYPVNVVPGSLTYTGYSNNGIGNSILIDDSSTQRPSVQIRLKDTIKTGSIYFSFLLNIRDTLDWVNSTTGAAIFNCITSIGLNKVFITIRRIPGSEKFPVGIYKNMSSYIKTDTLTGIHNTALLVMRYKFSTSTDTLSLWLNPTLTSPEPSPDIISANPSDADVTDINGLMFKQTVNGGNIYIDALRVSPTWENMALPVELSSFTCQAGNNAVLLRWRTETETNNYGFDIERSSDSFGWGKIGFVPGNGSSNTPQEYTFRDVKIDEPAIYYYRLRQNDIDGNYKYSDVINVDTRISGSFTLMQNYPNPFNPLTTLHFSLPDEGYTTLNIFNLTGERVKVLKEGNMTAGFYSVEFDASGLSSGTYFAVLEHSGSVKQIKLLVVK